MVGGSLMILLKVALSTKNQINQSYYYLHYIFGKTAKKTSF
jgi:hypothetical protein